MNCSKCGAEIEEGVKFCPSCGSQVEEQTASSVTGEYQQTASTTGEYQQAASTTGEYQQAASATGEYQQAASATGEYQQASSTAGVYQDTQQTYQQQGYQQSYQQGYQQQGYQQYQSQSNSGISVPVASVLCYFFGILGWIIAFAASDKDDPFLKFHLNQALVIFLFSLLDAIPVIGVAWAVFMIVCWFIGVIGALNKQMNPAPLVSKIVLIK